MEDENEEESSLSFTPSNSVRKNLLARFENSDDSGFYSATPNSREQSYRRDDVSLNRSNYFMTPINHTLSSLEITPDVINNSSYLHENLLVENISSTKVDREEMMNLNCPRAINMGSSLERLEPSSFHEKSISMECEESFYDDNATASYFASPGSKKDLYKESLGFKDILKPASSPVEEINTILHDEIPVTPILSPKTLSPIKNKPPISKSLLRVKSLCGFEHVDFFYFLGQKNSFPYIITNILSYLPASDLLSVSAVSKVWFKACYSDKSAKKRLQNYRKSCATIKENLRMSMKEDEKMLGPRTVFSQIQNIQNTENPQSSSPTVSPRTRRFKLFCKEGAKLDKNSKLMHCPRCRLPARCTANSLGQCLCKNCQYKFCTTCLKEYHYPTRCYRISSVPSRWPGASRQSMIIGSKASKRRLSRT